jgi:hypothetical protein
MSMLPTSRQNNVLNALLATSSFTAPVTGVKVRLDSTAPTAAASGTELPNGGGYTTGGLACTFTSASGGTASSSAALAWNNTGGTPWTIVGIEINDYSGNRFLYGTWMSAPITIAPSNSFTVPVGSIIANAAAW